MTMFIVISREGWRTKTIVTKMIHLMCPQDGVRRSRLDCRSGFESD
jgi:hypothetical protein